MKALAFVGVAAVLAVAACAPVQTTAGLTDCTGLGPTTRDGECVRSTAPARGLGIGKRQMRNAAVDRSLGH